METSASWAAPFETKTFDAPAGALRYVEAGTGRPIVLLHTLRTQLDMFHEVVPALRDRGRVIAVDLPGHGHSARPQVACTPDFYTDQIAALLSGLGLANATVVGESIGAGVALLLASRGHQSVAQVVAVNPYDYDRGRGVRRSAWVASVMFAALPVAGLGSVFWSMRSLATMRMVMRGGVTANERMPEWLLREIYAATKRPGDGPAFRSLVKHFPLWEATRESYGKIAIPVDLVYGDRDWSRPEERERTRELLRPRSTTEIPGGHFLSLDRPDALAELVARAIAAA